MTGRPQRFRYDFSISAFLRQHAARCSTGTPQLARASAAAATPRRRGLSQRLCTRACSVRAVLAAVVTTLHACLPGGPQARCSLGGQQQTCTPRLCSRVRSRAKPHALHPCVTTHKALQAAPQHTSSQRALAGQDTAERALGAVTAACCTPACLLLSELMNVATAAATCGPDDGLIIGCRTAAT